MLITAMPTQISEMRTTWAVFTDLVLVIREARNDPRSSTAFGAAPLPGPGLQYHGCGPDAQPDRAQAHGEVRPCGPAELEGGLDATLCQPGVHLLVDLRADPLDQPFGHRA